MKNRKLLLLILDGFGLNPQEYGNAIAAAHKPEYDEFYRNNPHSSLQPAGLAVGLPAGVMGNSEVGHLNIGAGRIVYQMNTMIDKQIEDGSFFQNPALLDLLAHVKKHKSRLHLFGLLSDGNVHSYNQHLWALLELFRQHDLKEVFLHAFTDGRDTMPHSGLDFLREFQEQSKRIGIGRIATISGRYYAMDRDKRWDRVEKAYRAITRGEGERYSDPVTAIEESYQKKITDEFILPTVITEQGNPVAVVQDNDAVLFFNFRADRSRQLTRAFVLPDFAEFPVTRFRNLKYTTFSEYDTVFSPHCDVCFRLPELRNILGEVISRQGWQQLRLAETEKYAHVTFFFNGGKEEPFPGEDRQLVPSPKVATYDLQPEMSAFRVRDELIKALQSGDYRLIITNFANCDMVGHTGIMAAARQAVETVDTCLQDIIPAARSAGYDIILTADHGNAEKMLDEQGNAFTAHTTNDVPVIVSLADDRKIRLKPGILADIAPTILYILGIQIPAEMTGKILIEE